MPSELQTLELPLLFFWFHVTCRCSKAEICPFSSFHPKDVARWRVLGAFEPDIDADSKALNFRLFSAQKRSSTCGSVPIMANNKKIDQC